VIGPVRCPICDAAGYACTGHVPITSTIRTVEGAPMELAEYDVVINGHPTTALLTAAQAQRLGATATAPPVEPPPPPPPTEGTDAPTASKSKQRKPANK
jgi:hypothetical protein